MEQAKVAVRLLRGEKLSGPQCQSAWSMPARPPQVLPVQPQVELVG